MTYLVVQMLLCLLIAFLLGLLLGWWLGRRKAEARIDEVEERARDRLERCRKEREAEAERAGACREELATCRKELEKCLARRDAEPAAPVAASPAAEPRVAPDVDAPAAPAAFADVTGPGEPEPEPDDLTRVEGIGPKIAGLLNAAGIATWAQLAEADVGLLQSVLDAAGPRYRIHDPSTWPAQAALAAAGSWDELEALQDRLKGGREA